MYNSTNLPLSSLKVIKRTIQQSGWALAVLIPLGFVFGYASIFGLKMEGVGTDGLPFVRGGFFIILGLIFLFGVCVLIYEYLYYKLYYYNFEDGGAEIRKGVISRATGHVRYERLQNIYLDQDVLDRIFGLYDVHYETAGEVSGFYSHVDGINKENADKLVAFLNEKAKGGGQGQCQYSATNNMAQPSGQIDNSSVIELSRENCPISSRVIYERTLAITFLFAILIISVVAGLLSKNTELIVKFEREENFLGFVVAITPYWLPYLIAVFVIFLIYNIVWYKNFYFSFGSERGEIRSKVIGQSISYLYYNRIQNINISQGFIERLFGIYTLIIETAGETSGTKLTLQGFTRQNAERIRDFLLEKAKRYKKL